MKKIVLFSVFVLSSFLYFGQSCSIMYSSGGNQDSIVICQNDIEVLTAIVVGLNPTDTLWIVDSDTIDFFQLELSNESAGGYWYHLLVVDSSDLNNIQWCTDSLFIFINPVYNVIDPHEECDSFTWIDGNTYTSSNNTATFTILGGSASGCDSIVTLNLTINNSTNGIDEITACNSYTWIDGNTYTASNNSATYNITGGASNGCDSLVTLNLTINNAINSTDIQSACEPFTWIDGNTYTSSNNTATFTILGGSASGCDSIVTLNLTIFNNSSSTDTQIACDSYTWIDGETYTSSNNTATHTIPNAEGCDSVITLNLILYESFETILDSVICDSELPFEWYGIEFNEAGVDSLDELFSVNGCDSTVFLNLFVESLSLFPTEIEIIESSGALPDDGIICVGDSAALNVDSIPGGNYEWSNGGALPFIIVDPSVTTEYSLVYTYGVCSATPLSAVITADALSTGSSIYGSFSDLCLGASDMNYYVNFTPDCSYEWSLNGGIFQETSNSPNVTVNWLSELSDISLTITDTITGCMENYNEPITFSSITIPEPIFVSLLDESINLLVTENNPIYNFYTWGSRNKINVLDDVEYNTNVPYHSFDILDTINRYYYVKHGNESECLRISYYNSPPNLGVETIDNSFENIELFPNPVTNYFELKNMDNLNNFRGYLFQTDGRLLMEIDFDQMEEKRIEHPFLPGTYLLKISNHNNVKTFRFIVL